MIEYVFFIFAVTIFLILVRESIIDIKTMYVPDNITFALYTTALVFLGASWFLTRSFDTIKGGILGFLLGFGVPFAISFVSYIVKLVIYKSQRKKENDSEATSFTANKEENQNNGNPVTLENYKDVVTDAPNTPKKGMYKRILYWLLCFGFLLAITFTQTTLSAPVFFGIGLTTLLAVIVTYEKFQKIDIPIYLTAIGILSIALVIKNDFMFISLTLGAFIFEWILARLFHRFYKIEDVTQTNETDSEDEVEGGIGGGDILVFGALGLMFGVKGIIAILSYSLFSQLLIILSYFVLSKEKSPVGYVPFVPGITIGVYFYIMGFDLFNIQEMLSLFLGV